MSLIDKTRMKRHFDRQAGEYDRYADIQVAMAEHLADVLHMRALVNGQTAGEEDAAPRRVLDIGAGTGSLSQHIAERFSHAQLTLLDISEEMCRQARARMTPHAGRCHFITADVEQWAERHQSAGEHGEPAAAYDWLVSSAAFQWLNEPKATLQRLCRLLPANGMLAFAVFGQETFRELHAAFRRAEEMLALPIVPHGQHYAGWEEWKAWLNPMAECVYEEEKRELRFYDSVRHFLMSTKKVGAGNAVQTGLPGFPGGRRLIKTMEDCYESIYASSQGIPATYHLMYGVFRRKPV